MVVAERPAAGFLRLQERPCREGSKGMPWLRRSERQDEMDRSTYLVQLYFGGNRLLLWNYREGGSNTLVTGPSDNNEWTAISLCSVNEQHSLCW